MTFESEMKFCHLLVEQLQNFCLFRRQRLARLTEDERFDQIDNAVFQDGLQPETPQIGFDGMGKLIDGAFFQDLCILRDETRTCVITLAICVEEFPDFFFRLICKQQAA